MSVEPRSNLWRGRWLWLIFGGIIAALSVIGAVFLMHSSPDETHQPPEETIAYPAYEISVRAIGDALIEYNKTEGTDTAPYPSDIHQLESMGYTTDISRLLTVRPQHGGDWLYFWAADSEDPSAALLISPRLDSKEAAYILLTTGGAVRIAERYVVEAALRESREPPEKVPAPIMGSEPAPRN